MKCYYKEPKKKCLNPYCSGRKNRINYSYGGIRENKVLILIVVEERIGLDKNLLGVKRMKVLILIVMEERIG